jgi:polyvinyl alcohol dehydrogenase (cytochrome)
MCIAKQWLILRAARSGAIASGIILSFASSAFADSSTGQWTMGGQDLNNSRTQSQGTISQSNVANLKLKWVFTTGSDVTATPAVAGNTVYFPDFAGNFYAVNATTGALVWSQTVSTWTGVANDFARDDPAYDNQTLFLGDQAGAKATWTQAGGLVGGGASANGGSWAALNPSTGQIVWQTATPGACPSLVAPGSQQGCMALGPASAANGVVFVGSMDTNPQNPTMFALNASTGNVL